MNYYKNSIETAIRKDMVYKIKPFLTNVDVGVNIYGIRFYLLKENETETWIFGENRELRDDVFNRICAE
jgi:hypothetical protein